MNLTFTDYGGPPTLLSAARPPPLLRVEECSGSRVSVGVPVPDRRVVQVDADAAGGLAGVTAAQTTSIVSRCYLSGSAMIGEEVEGDSRTRVGR